METRVTLQPAYVLHSRPFQNTSLLVDFFTYDYGRVKAIAKGARREKSRYRSLLQLFQPLLASFSGRGEIKTLTSLESQHVAIQLVGERLFSGMYINELLVRLLLNQEEHAAIYSSYQETLAGLQNHSNYEPVLRRFELNLLADLGYAINLTEDFHDHKPIAADSIYQFTPDIGFESSAHIDADSDNPRHYSGAHLIALREMQLDDPAAARSAKRLLRQALAAHLGDKPLNSRNLFVR